MKKETMAITAVIAVIGAIMMLSAIPFRQSGCMSRLTGGTTKLPAPEHMVRVINFGKTDTKKYISYLDADGKMKIKEYSDSGFLEAEYELDGVTVNTDLTVKKESEK